MTGAVFVVLLAAAAGDIETDHYRVTGTAAPETRRAVAEAAERCFSRMSRAAVPVRLVVNVPATPEEYRERVAIALGRRIVPPPEGVYLRDARVFLVCPAPPEAMAAAFASEGVIQVMREALSARLPPWMASGFEEILERGDEAPAASAAILAGWIRAGRCPRPEVLFAMTAEDLAAASPEGRLMAWSLFSFLREAQNAGDIPKGTIQNALAVSYDRPEEPLKPILSLFEDPDELPRRWLAFLLTAAGEDPAMAGALVGLLVPPAPAESAVVEEPAVEMEAIREGSG